MTDIVKDFLKVMKHKSEVSNGDVGKVEVRKGIVDRYTMETSLYTHIVINIVCRRIKTERVSNPLLNEFFNDLDDEETSPFTLVFHGMAVDSMEQVESIYIPVIKQYL